MQTQADYMQTQAERMMEHVSHLDLSLSGARDRIDELENSRIWRMTQPLRTAGQNFKVARARLRAAGAGVKRLPQLSALAWSILRTEGPAALAQRMRAKVAPEEPFKPVAQVHFEVEHEIATLAFTPAAAPIATIVIPVYGKPLLTYTCLKSLHAHTPHDMIEIIVVDDASPEPTEAALPGVTGVRFERNAENLGFIGTCNHGAALARGEFYRVPQQRYDRRRRLAGGDCCAFSANIPTPDWSAPSSSIPMDACRRPAASSGVTARPGTMDGEDDPDRPEYKLRARGRLLLRCLPCHSDRPLP